MNSQGTCQVAQPFANQAVFHRSELDHLFGNFPDEEAQSAFSYFPNQQISQEFLQPSYELLGATNSLEGYTWLEQDNSLQQAAADIVDPLQSQTSVQLQQADHRVDEQVFRPSLDDRLTRLEDKIGGLELVTQNLRNELEEKMRFFAEMETYILKLVAWTKESKDAVDSLVAELKAAVEVVTSK